MIIERAPALPDVLLITPKVHGDQRGWFFESYNRARFAAAGLDLDFPQSNVSRSRQGVLRGLHFQQPRAQGKLVYVLEGAVFDVAVDIRRDSATFGRWHGEVLSTDNHRMMYVPEGFAHGFLVLSSDATFCYFCTELYDPACEAAIRWDDPDIGIAWPQPPSELSVRDRTAPTLKECPVLWGTTVP